MPIQTAPEQEVKTKKSRKKVDLSSAKVVDGALEAPKSVYEICGVNTSPYRTKNFDEYCRQLDSMQFYELQTHAQKVGVLPSHTINTTKTRLKDAFLRQSARFARRDQVKDTSDPDLREQAHQIMQCGA